MTTSEPVRQDTLAAVRVNLLCECGASLGSFDTANMAITSRKQRILAEPKCGACGLEYEVVKVSESHGVVRVKHDLKGQA